MARDKVKIGTSVRTGSRAPRTTTIADLAVEAGVSAATVSKVMNGRPDVAPTTRRRIEALIHEHGYERVYRSKEPSRAIELTFFMLESEWALEIIKGVEEVAATRDVPMVVSQLRAHTEPERTWEENVLARRPLGVIAVLSDLGTHLRAQLKARGIPVVVVDPTGEPVHDTPSLGATNWTGALVATRHLASLGHRRIGMITGPDSMMCSRARYDGYRTALREAGIENDPRLVRAGSFQIGDGIAAMEAFLRLDEQPTAIFAGNDMQALGVYQAARDAGLRIPEDLSVVGFDDVPVARWVGPPLTTVRQPLARMGQMAAEFVLRMAAGETLLQSEFRVELATELVIRQSTAEPANHGRVAVARLPAETGHRVRTE